MTGQSFKIDVDKLPILIEGMSFKDYLEDPCPVPSMSSSMARRLLESAPARVWHETRRLNPDWEEGEGRTIFDIGTAAHAQLIGEGDPIVVIPYDSYRSNAAQEMRDEAYAMSHTPVLEKNMDRVIGMEEAALLQLNQNDICREVLESNPVREGTVIWNDVGVVCRARPDLMIVTPEICVILHYKTTSSILHISNMSRFAANQSWEIIASHYEAALTALYGRPVVQVFAVQETAKPYQMMILQLKEAFIEVGEMRRQRALEILARCLRSGNWPGHDARTIMVELPPWHEKQQIEAKDREEASKVGGKDVLDLSMRLQAPDVKVSKAPETVPKVRMAEKE